jgi:hypothetical protein
MSTGTVSHPIGRCKSRSSDPPGKSDDAPTSPRSAPPATADRDRRLAELREALADAAPAFWSQTDEGDGEAQP